MKKLLLKSMLLLCALIVGSGTMWADDYSYTFNASSGAEQNKENTLGGKKWTLTTDPTDAYWANEASGLHVGSKSYGVKNITLNSSDFSGKVTKVIVTTFGNGSSGTVSVTVGGTAYAAKNSDNAISSSSKNLEFTGNSTGEIVIVAGYSSKQSKNVYIATISVTTAAVKELSSISLSGTYPTSFTEQDDFSHEGMIVTANYGDSSTEDVTSSATFTGYDMDEVGDQTVTVSYTEGSTTKTATYDITVNAGPKYTVTFDAEEGTCGTASLTEEAYKSGVTLPSATCTYDGWTLAGWATSASSSTNVKPTVYAAGSTYKPTSDIALHAVYTLSDIDGDKYKRATSVDQITAASSVVIVNNKDSYVLNHSRQTSQAAPTESDGKITPNANTIFAFSGDNNDGFTLTGENGTLGVATLPTSSGSKATSWTPDNNKWIVEKSVFNSLDNIFVLRNANSTNVALDYNNGWVAYYVASYTNNQYTAMKVYVPIQTKYNSNPTASIVTPTMAFASSDTHTIYLDGSTTYTNAATLTGVDKSIIYTSSNTDVATVNSSGVVTAVGIGEATITASIDAELGVHNAASATYTVVVKNTTTIAGIKALSSDATEVNFTADLTDAVVTYSDANNKYAYIQDATAAIMVYVSGGHGLVAGKKINGAISGKVKAPYTIDQISSITVTGITSDAEVPTTEVKTLAQIIANAASLDGKKVTVNAVTVTESGTKITDDGGTTSITLTNPNNVAVNETEIGNFTGFVSTYVNGLSTTYRLNIYEASHYQKTQNVATDQTLTFDDDDVQLDEVTDDLASYTGQAVNGAHTTLTYEVDGASEDIVTSINSSTGELTLNGSCGTAIINVSAAAENIVEAGVTTPYNAANASYTITVNPRYIVTFSVNGVETTVRQATSGAAVAVPTPSDLGDYYFRGWKTTTLAPTDEKPSFENLGATVTPTTNNSKYYAVFAKGEVTGSAGSYVLDYSTDVHSCSGYGSAKNVAATDGSSWVVKAYDNSGMQINTGKNSSIKVPTCPGDISTIVLTASSTAKKEAGFSSSDYSGSGTISYLASSGSDATTQTISLSGKNVKDGYIVPKGGNVVITHIVVNYDAPITYSDYRTSLPTVELSIGTSGMLAFCYDRALDFSTTDVKAYKAKVEGGQVKLTKISDGIVPANTGIVLAADENSYEIPVATSDPSISFSDNEMVGLLVRTQVFWNPSTDVYNYILQGGEFKKASTGFLKANRAYLSTSYNVTAAGARDYMEIVFEDEPTAIRGIENGELRMENSFYDLQGRKVAQPTKGLYIVNGKKVNVK